jgi:hypothetical protein
MRRNVFSGILPVTVCLSFGLALMACAGGDKKDGKADGKADGKGSATTDAKADAKAEDPGEASLEVAAGDEVDEGPVPPDSDMVFFGIEGALLPLACFKQEGAKLMTGKDCLGLVKAGEEVRVGSASTTHVTKVGEPVEPLCMSGSGKKLALAGEGIGEGATVEFGAWPRSTYKAITVVDEDSMSPSKVVLDEEQSGKLAAAIGKAGANGEGVEAHQVAKLDVNGSGKDDDLFFSVFVPGSSERYKFSGAFLAMDGDMDKLVLIEKSRSKEDVFEARATVDLNGDGTRELWIRMVFPEGAGDRLVNVASGKPEALGKWSCGA